MNWTPIKADYSNVPQDELLFFANHHSYTEGTLTWINFTSPKRWGIINRDQRTFENADDYTHFMKIELPEKS